MAITERRLTLDEFLALPEEEPALELEPDGTVTQKVSPKGKHSALQGGFVSLIDGFARPRRFHISRLSSAVALEREGFTRAQLAERP